MRLTLRSFGFDHDGPADDVDWVADVRDIPASAVDGYEDRDGRDPALQEAIMATSAAQAWQRKMNFDALVVLTDGALVEVGCAAGRHRSVAFVEVIAAELIANGHTVTVEHRDIDLPYPPQDDEDDDESDDDDRPDLYPFTRSDDAPAARTAPAAAVQRDTGESMDAMNVTQLAKARPWYEIKNAADDVAEVYIYDQIGEDWFGEGVTAKKFVEELNALKVARIDLHLNSPGGSVFDGVAIHNALLRHQATVTTYIDGLAASIASIIALAGERVVMADNALFMIHNPWGVAYGDSEELRKYADTLDKIRDTLVNTYAAKTGMGRDEIVAALNAETWYTAQEAQAAGFVDEVSAPLQIAASFDLARFGYRHAPTARTSQTTGMGGAPTAGTPGGAPEPRNAETFIPGLGFVNL